MSKVNNDVNPYARATFDINILLGNEISIVRTRAQERSKTGPRDRYINRCKKPKQRNVNGFTTACCPDVNHLTEGKLTISGRGSIGEKSITISFYWSL